MIFIFIGIWNMGSVLFLKNVIFWFILKGLGKILDEVIVIIFYDIYVFGI